VPAVFPATRGRAWGESARARLASLAADPRLPARIRRTAVAAAVGTVLALALSWPFGLAAAVITAGAGALYSSRTSVVIPAGIRASSAQRRTRRRLARLVPAGYLALHARVVPGTGSAIEHLVVGPAGVFVMGSHHWDRRLPLRTTSASRLFHGPFDETGRLDQARALAQWAAARIGDALGELVTVRPALVIYGPPVPWPVMTIAGVDVLGGRRLRRYLRREAAVTRAAGLTGREVELVYAIAAQVLPPGRVP
jgi:hypothetical protein